MKKLIGIAVLIAMLTSHLEAKDVVVIGHTMYQKQKIDYKTVVTFAADKEGKRVWNWNHAQRYCRNLRLNGYKDWQVSSRAELVKIMANTQGYNGLYVKNIYDQYMPEPDPKYFDVWMWTRNSKSSNLGAFVNFKKGKTGWADKKYKGYVICTRAVKKATKKIGRKSTKEATCKGDSKQELTHSTDWVASWRTCAGDGAIKKDGTLWQFGKVGGCDRGQIITIDPQTGKPEFEEKKVYHLNPKKIGNGFDGAKIMNGGYRVYAIKKDGTLWGWGEEFREKPILLSQSHDWVNFEIKWSGNGCDAYDVGLKKDGTLWRFPESFDYRKKSPMGDLKQIGKEKDWDKVVIGCSAMYALKKDGTLWIKRRYGYNFEKFDYNSKCGLEDEDKDFSKKLKTTFAQMPSQSFYNFESCNEQIMNIDKKAGTLCVMPEISYEW